MAIDILMTAKGMLYLDMLIGNLIRKWKEAEGMTEDELDVAIATEEARKAALDSRREAH